MTVQLENRSGPVVVVEDDIRALNALTELLEASGYSVVRAQNGQEALEATRCSPPPCLILLDLSMPVMDGWEFLRHQRREPSIANIPVIVITALVSAIPAGAKALITKPINVNRLLSLVERYCTADTSN
jgi:CheY-like chemotaxis protein